MPSHAEDERYARYKQDLSIEAVLRGHRLTFRTTWGLFSPTEVDEGTRLLLDHLEIGRADACLDIGCGYGPIGIAMAKDAPEGRVCMVDKDFVAVDYARRNAEVNGLRNCEAILSNGLSHVPGEILFDNVASNLPAKVGNEMFYVLFTDVRNRLKPGGRFTVVTVGGLREYVKRSFREIFGNYDKLKQGREHTVSVAVRE